MHSMTPYLVTFLAAIAAACSTTIPPRTSALADLARPTRAECDGIACKQALPAVLAKTEVKDDGTVQQTWCTVPSEIGETDVGIPKQSPVTVFDRICYVFADTPFKPGDDKTKRVLAWSGSVNQKWTTQASPSLSYDLKLEHEFLYPTTKAHFLTVGPIIDTFRKCGVVSYPVRGQKLFPYGSPGILTNVANEGWLWLYWWDKGRC